MAGSIGTADGWVGPKVLRITAVMVYKRRIGFKKMDLVFDCMQFWRYIQERDHRDGGLFFGVSPILRLNCPITWKNDKNMHWHKWKRHLISQVPLVIIYLESESDVNPICPQLNYDYLKEINILNFGRWGCLFLFVKMIIYVRQSRKNY